MEESQKPKRGGLPLIMYVAIGLALGSAMGNPAIGLCLGLTFGILFSGK